MYQNDPLVRNKLRSTIKWRSLPLSSLEADDETKRLFETETRQCRDTGSVIVTASSSSVIAGGADSSGGPTLSEFLSINQFHAPTFGRIQQQYNVSNAICGATSSAAAIVLCSVLSERGWWDRALSSESDVRGVLLEAVCDPRRIIPLVENFLHFTYAMRMDYLQSDPSCPAALKVSPKQTSLFFSEWTANFEISDFFHRLLQLDQLQPQQSRAAVLVPESASGLYGPTPNPFPKLFSSSAAAATCCRHLLLIRANLYPIVSQSKYLQRKRIEAEDKQFGGRLSGPGEITYAPGECAFFVDVLGSEVLSDVIRSKKEEEKNDDDAAAPAAAEVIDVDAPGSVSDDGEDADDVMIVSQDGERQKKNSKKSESGNKKNPNKDNEQQRTTTTCSTPLEKFMSPSSYFKQFCSAASSPQVIKSTAPPPMGCRVHVVDTLGHFVCLLCYVDSGGVPHGIVINSASGDQLKAISHPTVRVAFDLYVASVTAGFRARG